MTFGEAFPPIMTHVLEKLIYGYSSSEAWMLSHFGSPELSLSDTDAFLSLCKDTIEEYLKMKTDSRVHDFYQWELANDQRSLNLFKDVCL